MTNKINDLSSHGLNYINKGLNIILYDKLKLDSL
jgi:hypothetical protein